MCDEGVQRQPLQADLTVAFVNHPNNTELRFDLAHLNVENFTGPKLAHDALNYQTADAHVRYKAGLGERLAVSIHSPNLHRKLNFDSWAKSSIHGRHCATKPADWKLTRVTAN